MKLKSLILGSVAAAGLSTAGFAADLGVLTSLIGAPFFLYLILKTRERTQ